MSMPNDEVPETDDYAGDPPRPDPWTTKRPLEGMREAHEARVVCLSPDVCLTPRGSALVPIPYQIVDYGDHFDTYASSVRFTAQKAMVLRSRTTHVHGDEPGTGGGVKSGTHRDITEPIGHAPQVRAEGSPVIRHLDRFWMNRRNTVGEAVYVKDQTARQAPEDDDPLPGSLRRVT